MLIVNEGPMTNYPAELKVNFGIGGNGKAFTVSGWAEPEPLETWSIGTASRLVLPQPESPATYVMVLKLRPHISGERLKAQRLGVVVNGVTIADFNVLRTTQRACLIPWSVIAGCASLEIDFYTPDAAPPTNFGSSDRRQLAVAFSSLGFYPDPFDTPLSDEPINIDVATIMAADQMPLHELLLHFESLGQNCEFGLVQRECLAEPLGLLRFSSTPLPILLNALEAKFEGIGMADTTEINISSNGREFMIKDTRFGFLYHAWVKTGEMAVDDILKRELRRVPFLARKLLEDLQVGRKTFVFKGMSTMPEEDVFPLAAALRRYGPNTLLFVNLSDVQHPGGTVEMRAPGFFVGYLDRFSPSENAADFLLSQWVKICRTTHRLRLAMGRS